MSEDKQENEHVDRMVSRRRKLFDIAIGSSIPVVLSLSISLINRIDNLEHSRDLVKYRVEQLYTWRDHGDYRRHIESNEHLAESVGKLVQRSTMCEYQLRFLERQLENGKLKPKTDKSD